jgi:hypothetical protein
MHRPVVTKNPAAVAAEVQSAYRACFPTGDALFVSRVFAWASDCFTGRHPDYQAIDAPYHDFEHTLQGTLCMARLLQGRHQAGTTPPVSEHYFQLGLLAILLHDTGYLKQRGDDTGTGAKYTVTHVTRSTEFAAAFLRGKNFSATDILAVRHMISCTGVDSILSSIPFQNEVEKVVGHALGTADLLGQMAADDYVEKLPVLYGEFAEAARFSPDDNSAVAMFASAEELTRKTASFWEKYVRPKLERDFDGLYRFLNLPLPDGSNDYVLRVEANIQRLRQQLAQNS